MENWIDTATFAFAWAVLAYGARQAARDIAALLDGGE